MSSLVVEIFRSDDYVPDGEIPLLPLLGEVFAKVIGPDGTGVVFELSFYQLMDLTRDRGHPSIENLRASHGYVRVRILRDGKLIYQHPHPVRELIGESLRSRLRKRDPEVTHWGYGVRGPGLEAIALSRPAPRVTHEVRVRTGPQPRMTFSVEEMPEPDPPVTTLAALGGPDGVYVAGPRDTDGGNAGDPEEASREEGAEAEQSAEPEKPADQPPVVIVIPGDLVTSLVKRYPFSDEIEEGGFLAGSVYLDADRPGGYLVHVTAALPAERTGASMINFTFTGESFLRVSQQLEKRDQGEKLLGWYHTHLFAATSRLGLSSVDVELHRSTFRRPWQVAGLVNITDDRRVLRFYHGEGKEMALVPYWTVPSGNTEPPATSTAAVPGAGPDMSAEITQDPASASEAEAS
jgi:proteasome lid subunit RPN8/RPN11